MLRLSLLLESYRLLLNDSELSSIVVDTQILLSVIIDVSPVAGAPFLSDHLDQMDASQQSL